MLGPDIIHGAVHGTFICKRCGSVFRFALFSMEPSMEFRCPFCGKNMRMDGKDEHDIIDDIVDWGKKEFRKLDSNINEGTVTAKLRISTIEMSLNYILNGSELSLKNLSAVHNIGDMLLFPKHESSYEEKHITIAQLIRDDENVLVKYNFGLLDD